MLLREMFSPIGSPKDDEPEIDWIDDLKFFIDNDDGMLNNHFFPAVKKHQEYKDHPEIYKVYIKPIQNAVIPYCKKFNVEKPEEKFPKEKLIDLAKRMAEEQKRHIENGDYETS